MSTTLPIIQSRKMNTEVPFATFATRPAFDASLEKKYYFWEKNIQFKLYKFSWCHLKA